MRQFAFLICAALVLLSGILAFPPQATNNNNNNNACPGNIPCLSYQVANSYEDGVEERIYADVTLPTYKAVACLSYRNALTQGYFHLSMYTRYGRNSEGQKLQMGVPVLVSARYVSDVDERCSRIYAVSFHTNATHLPQPTNPSITLQELDPKRFYVTSFWGLTEQPEDAVLKLRIKLNALGLCYNTDIYYFATYSSPSSVLNQRQEVWLPVRPADSCSL